MNQPGPIKSNRHPQQQEVCVASHEATETKILRRVWLSRTCFLNSSWRFLNIISFSSDICHVGSINGYLMSYDTISHFIKLWYGCPKSTKLQLFHLLLICLSKTSTAVLLRFKPDLGIWSQFPSQVPCKRPVVSPRIYVSTEVPIGPPGPDSKTKLRSENAKKTNISGRLRGSQCSQTNLQMFHWIGPRFCAITVSY